MPGALEERQVGKRVLRLDKRGNATGGGKFQTVEQAAIAALFAGPRHAISERALSVAGESADRKLRDKARRRSGERIGLRYSKRQDLAARVNAQAMHRLSVEPDVMHIVGEHKGGVSFGHGGKISGARHTAIGNRGVV